LQKGMIVGLATGLGAACADAIFGTIAVLGVSAILGFIHHYEASIRLIGGTVVLATAWHAWHDRPKAPQPPELVARVLNLARENTLMGTVRAALSGLVITLTNPLALFGTLALVATFGGITRTLEADVMVGGIFTGSALWWLLLSGGVGVLRCHCTENRIVTVNRATAIVLATLAIWAIVCGIHGYTR
jgi:putative LysE/RhtB family amino acid efflux pump